VGGAALVDASAERK
jgi:hypothetical protein